MLPEANAGDDGARARGFAPGSVGCSACMCRPHCWQYANPTGVGVPQRGHVIMLPCAATTFGGDPDVGGSTPGAVDGCTPGAPNMPGGGPTGFVVGGGGNGAGIGGKGTGDTAICVAAIAGVPIPGAPIPGAP